MSTTPADTAAAHTTRVQAELCQQIQLTKANTQQLQVTSAAVQDLQARVKPLQASVESLANQQSAFATQQAEMLEQLRTLTAALTARPTDQPAPGVEERPVPVVDLPAAPAVTPPTSREPSISSPRPYDGDFENCATFIMQCELVFYHQPSMFTSSAARIAYMTNLLTGRAAQWATASWSMGPAFCFNYPDFASELRKVFHHPVSGQDPGTRLSRLQQGNSRVSDYAVEFRLAAMESGWNDQALRVVFRRGLSEAVKDQLATREEPSSLDELIGLAIRIDGRLQERRREQNRRRSPPNRYRSSPPDRTPAPPMPPAVEWHASPSTDTGDEPMQLGRTRLNPAEREARFRAGLCLYCGQRGHLIRTCPNRPKDQAHQEHGESC